jgi:hypothetical protein
MYAADHDKLFGASPAAPAKLENVDFDALIARGRLLRSRQFAKLFDSAAAAVKRLFH